MKRPGPPPLARFAGVGFTVVGTMLVGLALGVLANRQLGWNWAIPAGIVLGFVAGMISMFRQLAR